MVPVARQGRAVKDDSLGHLDRLLLESATIIVFVKAPVPGEVKTRLIPVLREDGTANLYRALAQDTLEVVQQVPAVRVQVAYQVHPHFHDPSWLCINVPWFAQEGGDLGERLIHATERAFEQKGGPLVVIGSDLPTLTPALLEKSLRLLRGAPVVLGPSADGGYYLIALQRPMPGLFRAIAWSTAKVLEQTQQAVAREGLTARRLPMRRDLDTPDDLAHVRRACESLTYFPRTREFLRG